MLCILWPKKNRNKLVERKLDSFFKKMLIVLEGFFLLLLLNYNVVLLLFLCVSQKQKQKTKTKKCANVFFVLLCFVFFGVFLLHLCFVLTFWNVIHVSLDNFIFIQFYPFTPFVLILDYDIQNNNNQKCVFVLSIYVFHSSLRLHLENNTIWEADACFLFFSPVNPFILEVNQLKKEL